MSLVGFLGGELCVLRVEFDAYGVAVELDCGGDGCPRACEGVECGSWFGGGVAVACWDESGGGDDMCYAEAPGTGVLVIVLVELLGVGLLGVAVGVWL